MTRCEYISGLTNEGGYTKCVRYFNGFELTNFFGFKRWLVVIVLGLFAFVGAWAFAGAVRRVKAAQLIPLSPAMTWEFFASAETILVGLLWGWNGQSGTPIGRAIVYLFLNWAALLLLAGASALNRERLREWWSAGGDALTTHQRREIKNTLVTFAFALTTSIIGLIALWMSFYFGHSIPAEAMSALYVLPVAFCFALTVAACASFVQFCALQRFRLGGWAGVALVVVFYVFMAIAAALRDEAKMNNAIALSNPLIYAATLSRDDAVMERFELTTNDACCESERLLKTRAEIPNIAARGLVIEGALAFVCVGLAAFKVRQTRAEIDAEHADERLDDARAAVAI